MTAYNLYEVMQLAGLLQKLEEGDPLLSLSMYKGTTTAHLTKACSSLECSRAWFLFTVRLDRLSWCWLRF